jgi:hypothetical protein
MAFLTTKSCSIFYYKKNVTIILANNSIYDNHLMTAKHKKTTLKQRKICNVIFIFLATFNISIVLEIMEIIGNIKSSTKFLL